MNMPSPDMKREEDMVARDSSPSITGGAGTPTPPITKAAPNPEWEAKADAAHAAIVAEVGQSNPFDTLKMLETWKAHAEPADCDGRITFSRALLDSAADALRVALEMARAEYIAKKDEFRRGAQEMRHMLANFVEQGGDAVTANSLRLNWNPSWGADPGRLRHADGASSRPTVAEGDRSRDEPSSPHMEARTHG